MTPPADNLTLEWAKLFVAAIGGGLVVKLLDIAYQEFRRRAERRQTATRFVDQHLDPLLKAADELVGKFVSLGKEDFQSLRDVGEEKPFLHPDFGSAAYLVARFWTQVEILRLQALYISISEDERGRWLQAFLDCLESGGVRLIDRISQRAIGETLMTSSGRETVRYIDFIKSLENPETARWLIPLTVLLSKATHTAERQQLLKYVIVVHAMIDKLDAKHSVTRERPSVPGKLTAATWRDLHYRVFKVYLPIVSDTTKYIGRPRRKAEKSG